MSGAAIADAAGLGSVLVPAMKKNGYDEGFALGLTGASSLIGPIMPPSIPAIVYAVVAGVSVGALFFAGVLPALVLTAISVRIFVFVDARRNPTRGEAAAPQIPLVVGVPRSNARAADACHHSGRHSGWRVYSNGSRGRSRHVGLAAEHLLPVFVASCSLAACW